MEVTPKNLKNRDSKNPDKTYKNRRSKVFCKRDFKSLVSAYSTTPACRGIVTRFWDRVKWESVSVLHRIRFCPSLPPNRYSSKTPGSSKARAQLVSMKARISRTS